MNDETPYSRRVTRSTREIASTRQGVVRRANSLMTEALFEPQHPGFPRVLASLPRGARGRLGAGRSVLLVEVARGMWALAPGSKGSRTADTARIEAGATDILGRPLVRDGVADPGALAWTT